MSDILYGTIGFVWLFYVVIWIQPATYLVLRWRAYREGGPADPHLGIKSMLYFFKTIGYHALLAAGFALIYGLFNSYSRGELVRLAVGLALGGGLIYGLMSVLIDRYTNTKTQPAASRLYSGFNLLITGLVGSGALLGFFVLIVQSQAPGGALKGAISLLVVYGAAAVVQLLLLLRKLPPAALPTAQTDPS